MTNLYMYLCIVNVLCLLYDVVSEIKQLITKKRIFKIKPLFESLYFLMDKFPADLSFRSLFALCEYVLMLVTSTTKKQFKNMLWVGLQCV